MALPAALVLLDVYPLRRGAFTWRHLVVEKAGHWIVGAGGALGALVALEVSGLRITSYGVYGPAARIAMVAYSFWFYPAAWAWPVQIGRASCRERVGVAWGAVGLRKQSV